MKIKCPKCGSEEEIATSAFPTVGGQAYCHKCKTYFTIKQTTLAPPPKTRTITYIEKDLMTGKIEAVKRYTIPDK
jgi:transposase-like protein